MDIYIDIDIDIDIYLYLYHHSSEAHLRRASLLWCAVNSISAKAL